MKLKKVISMLLISALIFTTVGVFAEESELITSIADGDVITNSVKEFTLSIGAGYDVLVYLDGEEVLNFVSEGNDTFELPSALEVGKHKMAVFAKSGEEVLTQEIGFSVNYKGISKTDSIYTNQDKLMALSPDAESKAAGFDENGVDVTIARAVFAGKDGTAGGAVGFKTSSPLADITGAKHIHLPIYWGSTSLSGIVEIDYDIKLDGPMRFELETKGTNGAGNFGTDNMINNGKIAGRVEYELGRWYHIKHIVNLDTAKQDLYVDGEAVRSNLAVANPEGINTIKVQVRGEVADVVSAVAIDNFVLGYPCTVSATQSVSYETDDEYVLAEGDIIAEETENIRLTASGVSSVNTEVTIYADGEEFAKVNSRIDAEGNIDIALPKPLPKEASVKFVAVCEDYSLIYKAENKVNDVGVMSMNFETANGPCYASKQLNPGDAVTINFNLYSRGSALGTVVGVLYNGNTVADIKAKTPTSAADSLTLNVPDEAGEYTVECYLFNTLPSHKPLSKIWYLN